MKDRVWIVKRRDPPPPPPPKRSSLGFFKRSLRKQEVSAIRTGDSSPVPTGSFHRRSMRRAWRQFHEGSLSHWTTTLIIALALTIYGAFSLLLTNVQTLMESWRGENVVTVFLQPKANPEQIEEVRKKLADKVGTLQIVPPEEAMGRLKNMLSSEANVLAELEENPLPYSLEFKMSLEDNPALEKLMGEINQWKGVDGVSYDRQWAKRLDAVIQVFRYGGMVFSFLLLSVVALIISNTIKLTIMARSNELEVMRFMGATDAFIKTPFIYEGILQGVLGAILSLVLTTLLWLGAREVVIELGRAFALNLFLHPLPYPHLAFILALGILLGLTGALISVSRFLKV
ncbi:MAG: ABC transporter permease [Magnetococcales bacterium]|nr:ABC transporter permease [Magnetococcales bacterium]NGZ27918.1 ABC transporter permease [Magnetococcales bacterium]